jgi:uncharacterized protein
MAADVFVDTAGWYALIDLRDSRHEVTKATVERVIREGGRLVTTDYVIDESCTLARARAGTDAALRLLDLLNGTSALDREWIGAERFAQAEAIFRKYRDHAFSFTDCTSFAVMQARHLHQVITSDGHFRIMGFQIIS